jgi:hypothetical protein
MPKMKVIAGIGSQDTPRDIQVEMFSLGQFCKANGIYVRSGGADGADKAFFNGAREFCINYLPDERFGGPWPNWARTFPFDSLDPEIRAKALRSVDEYHPNPEAVRRKGPRVVKLIARDYLQIMGSKEPVVMSQAVVCWTLNGSGSGGTGQAIRVAKKFNIPVYDLGSADRISTEEIKQILLTKG